MQAKRKTLVGASLVGARLLALAVCQPNYILVIKR
jgi:hypothetical protein